MWHNVCSRRTPSRTQLNAYERTLADAGWHRCGCGSAQTVDGDLDGGPGRRRARRKIRRAARPHPELYKCDSRRRLRRDRAGRLLPERVPRRGSNDDDGRQALRDRTRATSRRTICPHFVVQDNARRAVRQRQARLPDDRPDADSLRRLHRAGSGSIAARPASVRLSRLRASAVRAPPSPSATNVRENGGMIMYRKLCMLLAVSALAACRPTVKAPVHDTFTKVGSADAIAPLAYGATSKIVKTRGDYGWFRVRRAGRRRDRGRRASRPTATRSSSCSTAIDDVVAVNDDADALTSDAHLTMTLPRDGHLLHRLPRVLVRAGELHRDARRDAGADRGHRRQRALASTFAQSSNRRTTPERSPSP